MKVSGWRVRWKTSTCRLAQEGAVGVTMRELRRVAPGGLRAAAPGYRAGLNEDRTSGSGERLGGEPASEATSSGRDARFRIAQEEEAAP
jgi:hypothetical protein